MTGVAASVATPSVNAGRIDRCDVRCRRRTLDRIDERRVVVASSGNAPSTVDRMNHIHPHLRGPSAAHPPSAARSGRPFDDSLPLAPRAPRRATSASTNAAGSARPCTKVRCRGSIAERAHHCPAPGTHSRSSLNVQQRIGQPATPPLSSSGVKTPSDTVSVIGIALSPGQVHRSGDGYKYQSLYTLDTDRLCKIKSDRSEASLSCVIPSSTSTKPLRILEAASRLFREEGMAAPASVR